MDYLVIVGFLFCGLAIILFVSLCPAKWLSPDIKGYLSKRPHLIPSVIVALMLIMATMNRVYHPLYQPPVERYWVPGLGQGGSAYDRLFGGGGSYWETTPTPIPAYYTGWGFFTPPNGYFQLLRWIVMAVALYIAYKAYKWQKTWAVWLFGFIAILFNPIAQITFERETWQVLDVICALIFLTVVFIIKQPDTSQKGE